MDSLQDGFPVPPLSKLKIRAAASRARKVLGLGRGPIDIARLLDELSAKFGIHYDVVDDASNVLPPGVEACYVPEHSTLYISSGIYAEMCRGGQRAMFTIGHELGHIVLAHRRTLNRRSSGPIKIFCNSEWQANRFAAEFTMPLDDINDQQLLFEYQLTMAFGVSGHAARIRLDDLASEGVLTFKRKAPEAFARF